MDKKLSELWRAALGQLQLNMSSANFNTWIKTLRLSELNLPIATVDAPNLMSKNYVERKFSDEIVGCLQQINPNIKKVVFKVQKPRSKNIKSNDNGLFEPIKKPDEPTQKNNLKESDKNNNLETTDQPNQNSLSSRYTFESFIVGSSNRLAFSAAQLVVEKPGVAYNPLFLYGPAGVGKTHLMWAIRNEIVKLQPDYLCLYITSEKFTNEYVNAIRRGEEFTNKYRQVDVLFVDDMQFIAGKEKTQEEFFHTFNTLHQNSKQIVLCSDRPPKEIPTLEERLRSRFEWGMVADISPPDIETRIAILLNKAALQNVVLEEPVAEYIASSVETNIRELEGALTKMIVYSKANNTDLNLEIAKTIFGEISSKKPNINAYGVVQKTADFYNLKTDDILGKKRDREIVIPRQVVMFILRNDLNLSFPKIASSLGGKDHTTIMHGSKKIEELIGNDSEFEKEIARLREYIKS